MSERTITQTPARIEINIVRDHGFYFYNRREDGRAVVAAQRIPRERAQEIMAENADDVKYQTGTARFDDGPHQFSWTVEIWPEEEEHG